MKPLIICLAFALTFPLYGKSGLHQVNQLFDQSISLLSKNPEASFKLADSLFRVSSKLGDTYGMVQANYIMAYLEESHHGNYGKSIIFYLEALRYADEGYYEGIENTQIKLLSNLGTIHALFNDNQASVDYYFAALEIANKSNNLSEIGNLTNKIAEYHRNTGDPESSLLFLNEADEINKKVGDRFLEVKNALHQGISLNALHRVSEAVQKYQYVIRLVDTYQDFEKYKGYALHNIANTFYAHNEIDSALFYYNQSLAFKQSSEPENKNSIFVTLYDIGTIHFEQRNFELAKKYLLQGESIIDTTTFNKDLNYYEVYNKLTLVYEAQNDIHKAHTYSKLYAKNLNNFLNKQLEIERLDKQQNLKLITERYYSLVNQQEKNTMYEFWSGLALLLIIVSVIFYSGYSAILQINRKVELEKAIRSLK